jgi:hypothetical protein
MKATANPDLADTQTLHLLPRWVTSAPGQGTDSVAKSSSAALALRDGVFRNPGGPLLSLCRYLSESWSVFSFVFSGRLYP